MRITQETKERKRLKILEIASELFKKQGFEKTTTRDISKGCGMAKGTLFNYFPSKEAIAMTMVAGAMEEGRELYLRRREGGESMVEDLFLFLASELRSLRPYRGYIGPVLESGMSVFAKEASCPVGESARRNHLETLGVILSNHNYQLVEKSVTLTLYWSLYLGILAHWSRDDSPQQAETLALVDYSMKLFSLTISGDVIGSE